MKIEDKLLNENEQNEKIKNKILDEIIWRNRDKFELIHLHNKYVDTYTINDNNCLLTINKIFNITGVISITFRNSVDYRFEINDNIFIDYKDVSSFEISEFCQEGC